MARKNLSDALLERLIRKFKVICNLIKDICNLEVFHRSRIAVIY